MLLGNEMKSDCQCDDMVLIMCAERANIINNQTKSSVIQLLCLVGTQHCYIINQVSSISQTGAP